VQQQQQEDPSQTQQQQQQYEEVYYDWRYGARIRYLRAGATGPPLLLAHGFGVGAYHFERNISALAQSGHRVYAVDVLGQGSSWPTRDCTPEDGPFCYSADTWTEQLHHFIQEQIGEPVYMVGNSLGG
jgi:pimeloyl-ACP methyl ester carboxylesterase